MSFIAHSADVIKAASSSTLAFICLIFLLLATLISLLVRKESWKVKTSTLGGFASLYLITLAVIVYRTPVVVTRPADPISQPVIKPAQTNVNSGNVEQSGSVNINGVGGSVNVQSTPQPDPGHRKAR
jgi:hypothetical protein